MTGRGPPLTLYLGHLGGDVDFLYCTCRIGRGPSSTFFFFVTGRAGAMLNYRKLSQVDGRLLYLDRTVPF